jgi:hypothetical protein
MSDELTVKVARAIVPLAYGDRENVNGRDMPAVSYDELSPDWQERWRIIASAAIDEARGWRDISIHPLPKDGTPFVICCEDDIDSLEVGYHKPFTSWQFEHIEGDTYRKVEVPVGNGYCDWGGINNIHRATHWMPVQPLPAPPKEG